MGVNGTACVRVPLYSADAQHLHDLSISDVMIDNVQTLPLGQGSNTSVEQRGINWKQLFALLWSLKWMK